jgi:hypothetical protein
MRINTNPTRRELRQFAWLWLAACTAGGFMLRRRGVDTPWPQIVWGAGAVVWAVGLWSLAFMRRVYVGLMYATFPIGWVVTHALLAVIFFGVFMPIGLLLRLTGRDPMMRRFDRGAASYWIRRDRAAQPRDYFRQF